MLDAHYRSVEFCRFVLTHRRNTIRTSALFTFGLESAVHFLLHVAAEN